MPRFTVEFDCIDDQQKSELCGELHKEYGIGLATEDAPAIISWLDGSIPQPDTNDEDAMLAAAAKLDELRNKETFDNIGKEPSEQTLYCSDFLARVTVTAYKDALLNVGGKSE